METGRTQLLARLNARHWSTTYSTCSTVYNDDFFDRGDDDERRNDAIMDVSL